MAKVFPVKDKFRSLLDLGEKWKAPSSTEEGRFRRLRVLVIPFAMKRLQITSGNLDLDVAKHGPGALDFVIRDVSQSILIASFFSRVGV